LIDKTKVPLFFDGKLYSAGSQAGLLARLPLSLLDKLRFGLGALRIQRRYGPVAHREFDPADPLIIELNQSTAAEFLGSLSPNLSKIWNAVATISDGESIDLTTAFHPVMVMLQFLEQEYAVVGGTHQLTLAIGRAIGDQLRLGAEVSEIHEIDTGVEVKANTLSGEESFQAERCVMAMPAPIARSLVKTLPEWKREVLEKIDYASQTSAAFLLDAPSERWMGRGVWRVPIAGHRACAITDPTFFYTDEVKRRTGQGLLRVYTGDLASKDLQALSRQEAIDELRRDLDQIFPGIAEHVIEGDIAHWALANPKWRVGHMDIYPSLQAPAGRIHFCGDYTSPGYMNGSVLSAYRVVDELSKPH
jgi:monoamine oxidase